MPKVCIVYIDAGGGHRATAASLNDFLRQQRPDWTIELLNADDVLEPVDPTHWITGVRHSAVYNWLLRHEWTAGTEVLVPWGHFIYRLLHPAQVRLFRSRWQAIRPDLVVSVVPHINRALFESLRLECPRVPFATLLTDFADYPPRFWIEPQRQHFICGTSFAAEQARRIAPSALSVSKVSGMILHPRFYEAQPDRASLRREYGLSPDVPSAVVLFGGHGAKSMVDIARDLSRVRIPVQAIFLCGSNRRLVEDLHQLRLPYRARIVGYTSDVARYMSMADFFIGKPGPASISEALAMGLPMILKVNFATMVQERYNVQWIREQQVGLTAASPRDIADAVTALLDRDWFAAAKKRIAALQNRAVFEVPAILEGILNGREQVNRVGA